VTPSNIAKLVLIALLVYQNISPIHWSYNTWGFKRQAHLETNEDAVADDEEDVPRSELGRYLAAVLVVGPGHAPRARHDQPGVAHAAFQHPVPLHLRWPPAAETTSPPAAPSCRSAPAAPDGSRGHSPSTNDHHFQQTSCCTSEMRGYARGSERFGPVSVPRGRRGGVGADLADLAGTWGTDARGGSGSC
jgi:hypothetical protein